MSKCKVLIMHEFSLCEGIIAQVKTARPKDFHLVKTVKVSIGEMAGVDSESLKFWFPVVAKQMKIAQLKLKIANIVALAQCNNCHQHFHLEAYYQACPNCASYADFELIQGKELTVDSILL